MRLSRILPLAWAEARLTRRLARYWVFLSLAYILGLLVYLYYGSLHAFFSAKSATAAMLGPRYLMAQLGIFYVLVYLVGIVFLAFDVRARDVRERMAEVLDSRPVSNLELLVGRFLGILIPSWVPVVVLALLMEGLGLLLPALGSPVGDAVEPWSMVAFTLVMTLPAFALALSLVFLVTLLVRNRLLAAVVMLVILGASTWAMWRLPIQYGPLLDLSGAYTVAFPSDIVPAIAPLEGWLQRMAVLVAAIGVLFLASAIHPRKDGGSRRNRTLIGVALLLAVLTLGVALVAANRGEIAQVEAWRVAHEERLSHPEPDIRSISGEVDMAPGKNLALSLDVVVSAPGPESLSSILLSWNPGLLVSSVESETGESLSFTHQDGLLEVELSRPLAAASLATLSLRAHGMPDPRFGYLDAVRDPLAVTAWEGQLYMLGFDKAVYDKRFVALMPGIRWLPAAGPDVARETRRPDFFETDLTVRNPEGWLVAGPGRREELEAGEFRFQPEAPVPEVALVAGPLESHGAEIEGVWMEVLIHRRHRKALDDLADAGPEVREWIAEKLRDAREMGLDFPYGSLSLVEVPSVLRSYGGGWRLGSVLGQPGMVLMREIGFPTARFDVPFRKPEQFRDREGGVARAKREVLEQFFANDFSGGNAFYAASKDFFIHQTAPEGPEGPALRFILEDLTSRLVTGRSGYFSAHLFNPDVNKVLQRAIGSFIARRGQGDFAEAVIHAVTSRPEVWDAALETSLQDMVPRDDPSRSIDVLTLKGGAAARHLRDSLEPEGAARLLVELKKRHRGGAFDGEDLVAAAEAAGTDLSEFMDVWLRTTRLPGFVLTGTRAYRLPDGEGGEPRYQLIVGLQNDEDVDGLVRVSYRVGEPQTRGRGGRQAPEMSDPILVPGGEAVEWGTLLSQHPRDLRVIPYLSLNREPFNASIPAVDEERIVRDEPLQGVRPADRKDEERGVIVVDDLDPGFSVVQSESGGGLRLGARGSDEELDGGIPVAPPFFRPPSQWSRQVALTAWGHYRHTTANIRGGTGKSSASFETVLPRDGSWQLEIHMPQRRGGRGPRGRASWGTWNLELEDSGGGRQELTFDSDGAEGGWNALGSFDLASGTTIVTYTDKTDGSLVLADAIRWRPEEILEQEISEEPGEPGDEQVEEGAEL